MDIMNMSSSFIEENIEYISKFIPDYAKFIPDIVRDYVTVGYTPWVFSVLGAIVIGLSGILPLFIIPKGELETAGFKDPGESKLLKVLLSFAVGGLLGDVFLHLLPEAWEHDGAPAHGGHQSMRSGLWVLSGILIFTIVEKIFSGYVNADEENPQPKCVEITNCLLRRTGGKVIEGQTSHGCTGGCDIEDVPNGCYLRQREEKMKEQRKEVAGYLNLLANSIDNFTHGLAVAGSFLVSFRHGVLATFAILLHEIPHEVGDFAILLRSGFTRWDAARAQLLTAGAGLMGAVVAIGGSGITSAMEARTSWIMPFTAGGFLHIALVTVLPEIVKEENPRESTKQILAIIFGILLMATMNVLFEC